MSNESETGGEALGYLDKIRDATKNGKMVWAKQNPTTFIWTADNRGKIVLQRVMVAPPGVPRRPGVLYPPGRLVQAPRVANYVLQVVNPFGADQLQVASNQSQPIHAKLEELYQVVEESLTRGGLDFLKSLLPE